MKQIVTDADQICKRFKQVRKEAGLTQIDFGSKIGLTREAVSAIELGRYCPPVDAIRKIKKNFGRSYNWILDGK